MAHKARLNLTAEKRSLEARECLDRMTALAERVGINGMVERYKLWDAQWRMKLDRLNKPWPHASEYNPPITFSKVEDVHAVLSGFFQNLNFFSMAPAERHGLAEEEMRKRAEMWTDLLRWSMANESNTLAFMDKWIHDGCLYGCAFGYLPWSRLSRNIQTEHFIAEEYLLDPDMNPPEKVLIEGALGDRLVEGPTKIRGGEGYRIQLIDDDGETKDATAFIVRGHPSRDEEEPVVLVEREAVYYNAPAPKCIAPWNMLIPGNADSLQTCERFYFRDTMSYDEVARMAKCNLFNATTEADLRALKAWAKLEATPQSAVATEAVDEWRDYSLDHGRGESEAGRIEVVFEYAFEDIDNDGYAESIVRAIANITKPILLMRHRLEYLYPHGRRPFFDWHLIPVDHRYYGMGIPEVLESTQIESNAFYQTKSDLLELLAKPFALYNPMSGLMAPEELHVTPGMLIPVNNVDNALRPFGFPVDPSGLMREQLAAEGHADKAIGTTDMGAGRQSSRPNAPRTLGGTAILVRQQQLRTNSYLHRAFYGCSDYGSGIQEFLHQYRELYAALMPREKEFRALGTNELKTASRVDLQGRFDFVVDFGEGLNNPQLRLQQSLMVYDRAVGNPLIQRDPQAFWHLTVEMMEAAGIKNPSKILPPPTPFQVHPPMQQMDELFVMAKGIYVDPLMTDNHMEHLTQIHQFASNPQLLATHFTQATLMLLERHTARHTEFMQTTMPGAPMSGQPQGGATLPQNRNQPSGPASFEEPQAGADNQAESEMGV
jgi:hypothetical protein